MNVTIDWEGTDITNYVIEYAREQDICTGVGTLDITVSATLPGTLNTWDKITIREDSVQVGEFNICSVEKQAPSGVYVIACQDDSKRLQDYFIDVELQPTSPTLSRYWLETVLNLAGVTYQINTDSDGEAVSVETQFGMQPAYDSVMSLLQLSGWYMYFDDDGTCQIGELSVGVSVAQTFNDSEIISTSYIKSDKMMRNRVVVWGASDPDSGWVWAEVQSPTEWDREDGQDYRTVVYSNSAIQSSYNANIIATKILDEFSQTIPTKEVVVAGFYPNIQLGDKVASASAYNPFSGKVTGILVNVGKSGALTTLTIDERCPRMFGYAYAGDGWIYIGTDGEGVWRKQFTGSTWYDYSDGITDLRIKDLAVYDNLLACVTATTGDLYLRTTAESSWTRYAASGFIDSSDPNNPITVASGVIATACSIDRTYLTGASYVAAFTFPGSGTPTVSGLFPPSGNKSWLRSLTPSFEEVYTHQIYIPSGTQLAKGTAISEDCFDVGTVDLETIDTGNNIISVQTLTSENYVVSGRFPNFIFGSFKQKMPSQDIDFNQQNIAIAGKDFFTSLPPPESGTLWPSSISFTGYSGADVLYAEQSNYSGSIGKIYAFNTTYTSANLYVRDRNWDGSWNEYATYNFSGLGLDGQDNCHAHKLVRTSSNTFNLFVDFETSIPSELTLYLYQLNIDDLSVSVLGTYTPPYGYRSELMTADYLLVQSLPGGVFCAVIYKDHYLENGEAPQLIVRTFNVEEGGYSDEIYVGPSVAWEDFSLGTIGYDDTPNYFVTAYVATIEGGVQYTVGENFWVLIIITINKYTGEVNIGSGRFEINKIADEVSWWMYGVGVDVDGIRATGSYRVNKTTPFVRGWTESIDYGISIGKIYVPIQAETITAPFEDYYSHNIAYLFTINITFASIISSDIHQGILHFIDDDFSWQTEQQAPAWLLEPGLDWSLSFNNSFVSPRLIQTVYSRNTLDTPVIFGGMRIDRDTPEIVQAAADKTSPDKSYSVLDFSDSGMNSLCHVSSLADDVDNTFYIVACSGTSNAKTAGMDFTGKLTKIEQTKKTYIYPESVLQSHMLYNGVIRTFQYWPSGIIVTSGGGYKVLTHNPTVVSGEFTVIYNWDKELYLDTGRGSPTVIFDKPHSGGNPNNFTSVTSVLGTTYQNTADSFTLTMPSINIYDARLFDITDNEFFPYSGTYPPSLLTRYIGVAGKTPELLFIDSELTSPSGFLVITQFPSGVVTHLDFTNYVLDPYVFCSVDTPTSGQQFFQRDTEKTYFLSRSINLPETPITIIRVDDNV
jgi:hypothetical protein